MCSVPSWIPIFVREVDCGIMTIDVIGHMGGHDAADSS